MKVFYFDTETTGVDHSECAIIQLAGIVEIDGQVVAEKAFRIKPFDGARIDAGAMEANGIDLKAIDNDPQYVTHRQAHLQLCGWFGEYVDKFDKSDKFIPVAYNGAFDLNFLSSMFTRCGDVYLGSWIDRNGLIDPLSVIRWKCFTGTIPALPNKKLTTVCDHFGITIERAHDAIDDIRATRALTLALMEQDKKVTAQ